jgi:hypothetical protein
MSFKEYFRIFAVHLGAILLVGACSSGSNTDTPVDDGGNQPQSTPAPGTTPEPTAEPTPAPTATPAPTPTPAPTGKVGEFIVDEDIAESDTEKYYDLGCMTPGQATGKKMVDPRLKVGDIFRERMIFSDTINQLTMDLQTTTKTVEPWQSFFNSKVLATTIPGTKVGQQSTTTCTVVSDTEGSCEGSSSAEVQGMNFYIFVPTQAETTYQTGWYVLDDGKGIKAWRKVINSTGIVLDPMQFSLLGPGTQVETQVYVFDIPSTGLDFCGGNNAFSETLVSLDDGTELNRIGGNLLGVTIK